jgi:peptide/nickel transport system permease protein
MSSTVEPILPKPTPLWRKALGNTLVRSGTLLVGLLILFSQLTPLLAPYTRAVTQYPGGLNADGMPLPPSSSFLLGTDDLGRDVLVRLLYGSRISLPVGIAAMLAAVAFGIVIGLYSGYYGGWVDVVLMRFTDIMMAVPALLLAMALTGLMKGGVGRTVSLSLPGLSAPLFEFKFERGMLGIILVIAIVSWTGIARVVRGQMLALKERAFVEAARAIGCSNTRILWRHLMPNVLPAIIVLCAMSTAGAIGLEAGLSYLGLGVPPPAPSWGTMISDGLPYFTVAPWLVLAPGFAIVLAVLGFNLLGQGLQDVLDPYHKRRT